MCTLLLAALTPAASTPLVAAADQRVSVNALCGRVVARGVAEDTVRIDGTGVEVQHSEGRTRITVGGIDPSVCVQLSLELPRGARLEVEGVATSLEATGIEGSVRLQTVSGDLDVRGARSVEGRTVSGSLRVETGERAEVELATVSGRIAIAGGAVERLDASAVSGDLSLTATWRPDARVRVSTHSGQVLVVGSGGQVHASTMSGRIVNEWTADPPSAGPLHRRLTMGQSGPLFEIETFAGNIHLKER